MDRPDHGRWHRALARVVPETILRTTLAAPALRHAGCAAGVGLLVVAAVLAQVGSGTGGFVLFTVTAPLVPLLGVALAYSRPDELCGEIGDALPYSRFRLLLSRTLAVVTMTLPATVLLSLTLPVDLRLSLLWLAASLALCAVTLASASLGDPRLVAVGLSTLWVLATTTAFHRVPSGARLGELIGSAVVFRDRCQLALVGVMAAALLVAVLRRTSYDLRRMP